MFVSSLSAVLAIATFACAKLTQHDAPSSSDYAYWLHAPSGLTSNRSLTLWLHGKEAKGQSIELGMR